MTTEKSAVLAEGDSVSLNFENSTVYNVAGDQSTTQNIGQVKVYNVWQRSTSESEDYGVWWSQPTEKIDDGKVNSFKEKLNKQTWQNSDVAVVRIYQEENLSDPGFVVHPQIKTGFRLYQGDYVPENGFVASAQPKTGTIVTFSELVDTLQERRHRYHAVISQAGGGKSVLLKRLARAMMLKNGLYQHTDTFGRLFKRVKREFDVVFHANIKDIPNSNTITPAETLFNPAITGLSPLEVQHGYQALLDGQINMLLILDGLDQACWCVDSERKISPWDKTSTAKIFGNVLSGHILRDVSILISSREHCVASLPADIRPQYTAALVGFTEKDAKMLFCALMEDGGEQEWTKMRISNPGLIYTSSIPLFAIFNVIVHKSDPKDPPDCVTGVMARIIEILLRSRHFHSHENMAEVINRLKILAFHGTSKKTVVFSNDDLKNFGLEFREISDIVIKVPGCNTLSEKLISGDFLYIFGHQALQEILTAYHICEMKLTVFIDFVDKEVCKGHWSAVTMFLCGILKNENVRKKISPCILKIEHLEEKCRHLIVSLESHLKTHSPIQRLDILLALREANALQIFRENMTDLQFSNFPLTTSVIHTLCCLMQLAKNIPYLSLSNCGIDEALFATLVSGTKELGIQIEMVDLTGNDIQTDSSMWKDYFHNVSVKRCMITCPRSRKHLCIQTNYLIAIAEAATTENVSELAFGHVDRLPVDGRLAKRLNRVNAFGTVKTLVMLCGEVRKSTLVHWVDRKSKRSATDDSLKESRSNLQEIICKMRIVNSVTSFDSLSSDDWKELGVLSQRYLVEEIRFSLTPDLSGIHKLFVGVKNFQFQCLVLHQGRSIPHASIRFSDRRICLDPEEDSDHEVDMPGQMRYADVIVDVDGQQSQEIGEIVRKCDFEAVLIAEWPRFNASSFIESLKGKKIKRLAVHDLDCKLTRLLRKYEATHELFYNKKIHDENLIRGLSRKMKVTLLSPGCWEEHFHKWW